MAYRKLRKFARGPGPIVFLVVLLLTTLKLMSDATQNSARFGELYSVLLIMNALGLITLGALIVGNFVSLLRQVRQRRAGARLTVRMVTVFVFLALTPVLVVYYFSLQAIHRGIDSWFDVRIERALDDSLELSRTSLGVRMRQLLKQTELLASDLGSISDEAASLALDDARFLNGATELALFGPQGRIVAASSEDPLAIIPGSDNNAIALQVSESQSYISLDPIGETGLHVRVMVQVSDPAAEEVRILQALFPIDERMTTLAESVQTAYGKYRELAYLREPLKISFTLTLSLVLLLSLFAAVWAAFYSARRLVAPLRDLVHGTQAVAEGDYQTQLEPSSRRDELGFLVDSFNDMTRKLARADDDAHRSRQQVEEQRTYLEAVLSRLSSGVITLDLEGRLFTANEAASQILGLTLDGELTNPLPEIAKRHPTLANFSEVLERQRCQEGGDWREQVEVPGAGSKQVLMCRGAPLPLVEDSGHVIVFDDVTALIQAQRDAAWSEVARRLAHEIKNPLTPIQLSAERLRQKYLGKMQIPEADLLDRLTRTIVQQVEGMKGMVNAFSEYARSPQLEPEPVNLSDLVDDVAELYLANHSITTEVSGELPVLDLDPDKIRQVLHNLIKNAVEASDENDAVVCISAGVECENGRNHLDIKVSDQGNGFPADILEQVFEPYVTSKPKGTGLGLAIVKKIVEEHGGGVRAENNPKVGASVIMRFPFARPDRGLEPVSNREVV